MVERTDRPLPTPEQLAAREALADLDRARTALVDEVSYPPGYLAVSTLSGALLPLGPVADADGVSGGAHTALSLLFTAGLLLSAVAAMMFASTNRVRVSGFRYARGLALGMIALMVVLVIGAGAATSTTGHWWVGLLFVPVAGAVSYGYQRRWLTVFRRQALR